MLRADACHLQVVRFREAFGDGVVKVTRAKVVKHATQFDWNWAAFHLLSKERGREWLRVYLGPGMRQKRDDVWQAVQRVYGTSGTARRKREKELDELRSALSKRLALLFFRLADQQKSPSRRTV